MSVIFIYRKMSIIHREAAHRSRAMQYCLYTSFSYVNASMISCLALKRRRPADRADAALYKEVVIITLRFIIYHHGRFYASPRHATSTMTIHIDRRCRGDGLNARDRFSAYNCALPLYMSRGTRSFASRMGMRRSISGAIRAAATCCDYENSFAF